jgi:hypothetical protein
MPMARAIATFSFFGRFRILCLAVFSLHCVGLVGAGSSTIVAKSNSMTGLRCVPSNDIISADPNFPNLSLTNVRLLRTGKDALTTKAGKVTVQGSNSNVTHTINEDERAKFIDHLLPFSQCGRLARSRLETRPYRTQAVPPMVAENPFYEHKPQQPVASGANVKLPYRPALVKLPLAKLRSQSQLPSALATRTKVGIFMVEAVTSTLNLNPRLMSASLPASTLGCYYRLMINFIQHRQIPN